MVVSHVCNQQEKKTLFFTAQLFQKAVCGIEAKTWGIALLFIVIMVKLKVLKVLHSRLS